MKRISRSHVVYAMDRNNQPSDRVRLGETLVFETYDCYKNQMLAKEPPDIDLTLANPATGPVFIEGARPGDTLKVEILDIECGGTGFLETRDFPGRLGARIKGGVVERHALKDNRLRFDDQVTLELRPMIGVIGTAPARGSVKTVFPGPHGANMDCGAIKAGAVVYLPVYVEGALLAMGDVHALMGDGETGGTGLEVEAEVTVKVEAGPGFRVDCPIVEADGRLLVVASAKTLDEAADEAVALMSDFMEKEIGLDPVKGISLIGLLGDLKICQLVNPLMTVAMSFPMDILREYGYQPR